MLVIFRQSLLLWKWVKKGQNPSLACIVSNLFSIYKKTPNRRCVFFSRLYKTRPYKNQLLRGNAKSVWKNINWRYVPVAKAYPY